MRKSLRQSLMIAFICGTSSPWLSSAFYIWLHFLSFSPGVGVCWAQDENPRVVHWVSEWVGLRGERLTRIQRLAGYSFHLLSSRMILKLAISNFVAGQKFRLLGYSKSWGPYWTKCNLSWLCHFLSQFTFCSRNLPEWINFLPYNNMGYISGQI